MAPKTPIPLVDDSDDLDNPQPGYRVVLNACSKALMKSLVFLRGGGAWIVGGYAFLFLISSKLSHRNKIIILSTATAILLAAAVFVFKNSGSNKNTVAVDIVDNVDTVNVDTVNTVDFVATPDPPPPPDNPWGVAVVPSYTPAATPNIFATPVVEPPPITQPIAPSRSDFDIAVAEPVIETVAPPVVEQVAPPAISSLPSLPVIASNEPLTPIAVPITVPIVEEPTLFPLPPPSEDPPMIAMLAAPEKPVAELVAPAEPLAPLEIPEPEIIAVHAPEDSPFVPDENMYLLASLLPKNTVPEIPKTVIPENAAPPAIIAAPLPKIGVESPVIVETRETSLLSAFAPILPPEPDTTSPTPRPGALYRAQPGDNWWNIAQRAYGSGGAFRALAEYNKHHVTDLTQLDGTVIELPPLATIMPHNTAVTPALATSNNTIPKPLPGTTIYITRDGETLQSIAETKLGSRSRDSEIARLNSERLSITTPLTAGMEILIPLSTGTQRNATAAYTRR